jgi:hypothetical protein
MIWSFNWARAVGPQMMAERDDPMRKLKEPKELLDVGIITQAEFEKKKAPLLERL